MFYFCLQNFLFFTFLFLKLFLDEPAMVLRYWLIQIVAQVYDDFLTLNLPTSLNQCLTNNTIWYPLVGCLIPLLMLIITTMHSPNIQHWTRPRCASKENGPLTLNFNWFPCPSLIMVLLKAHAFPPLRALNCILLLIPPSWNYAEFLDNAFNWGWSTFGFMHEFWTILTVDMTYTRL
jgi:hypothetical protein